MGEDDGTWVGNNGNLFVRFETGRKFKLFTKTQDVDLVGNSGQRPKNPRLQGHLLHPGMTFKTRATLPIDSDSLPNEIKIIFENEMSDKQVDLSKQPKIKVERVIVKPLAGSSKEVSYCSDGQPMEVKISTCEGGAGYCRYPTLVRCYWSFPLSEKRAKTGLSLG